MTGRPLSAQVLDRLTFADRDAPNASRWIVETLGEHLWSRQEDVLDALADHRRVAVPAGHAVGKSWLAARAVAHFVASLPVGEAFAVTTAPSQSQVAAILWRELRRVHRAARLPGRITGGSTRPEWYIGDELVAIGRKSADAADAEQAAAAFQGIHARYVLIVLDEAGGIPSWLWGAAEALMTNADARILAIGNPAAGSRFEQVCAPGSGWEVLSIPATSTPAFTDEPAPPHVLEALVSPTWVDEVTRTFGEGSPYVTARVDARFPATREDALIEPAWIKAAQQRDLADQAATTTGTLAADIARSGSDETVVYGNRGGVVRRRHSARGQDTMATTGRLVALAKDTGSKVTIVVDEAGLGGGVVDRLREQRGWRVVAFNAAHRPRDPDRFVNRRAEVFWTLRELLRGGELDLDPDDRELARQLGALRWSLNSRGRIRIESKDDMRARGVASPDRADAVAMSVATSDWRPAAPVDEVAQARRAIDRAWARKRRAMGVEEAYGSLVPGNRPDILPGLIT